MAEEDKPTGTPPVQGNPPAPGSPPPADPPEGKIVLTSAQLADRMERHTRSQLKKELGVEDPAALKERLSKLDEYEQEREKQRVAQLSADQRAAEERQKLQDELAAAKRRAESLELEAKTARAAAETGVKNLGYAQFRLNQALAAGQTVDEKAFFAKLAEDPSERAALGIAPPGAPAVQAALPTTTPGNGLPPAPPAAGTQSAKKTAFDMTAAEWAAYKEQNGL